MILGNKIIKRHKSFCLYMISQKFKYVTWILVDLIEINFCLVIFLLGEVLKACSQTQDTYHRTRQPSRMYIAVTSIRDCLQDKEDLCRDKRTAESHWATTLHSFYVTKFPLNKIRQINCAKGRGKFLSTFAYN